jgi:hypothetical protein
LDRRRRNGGGREDGNENPQKNRKIEKTPKKEEKEKLKMDGVLF